MGDSGEVILELVYVKNIVSLCAIVLDPWWFTKKYVISTRFPLETDDRSSSELLFFEVKGFKSFTWKETCDTC